MKLHNKVIDVSKKGFTLVELVVVIAVLAILAAIAIPTVITIMGNSEDSQWMSNAHTLDGSCKDIYAQVLAGQLNSSNQAGSNLSESFPSPGASPSVRKRMAGDLTVVSGVEFSGLVSALSDTNSVNDCDVSKFQYDSDGNITYIGADGAVDDNCTQLAMNTKFSDLYAASF